MVFICECREEEFRFTCAKLWLHERAKTNPFHGFREGNSGAEQRPIPKHRAVQYGVSEGFGDSYNLLGAIRESKWACEQPLTIVFLGVTLIHHILVGLTFAIFFKILVCFSFYLHAINESKHNCNSCCRTTGHHRKIDT